MINNLCEILCEFNQLTQKTENCESLFLEGPVAGSHGTLRKLIDVDRAFHNHITLFIDDFYVSISNLQNYLEKNQYSAEFRMTVDTKALIQEVYSGGGDIDEFLFTTIDAFNANLEELGVLTPLVEGKINKDSNTRIHVYGLQKGFGGPKLAVIPLNSSKNYDYGDDWLKGSSLPSAETLLKQVHLITNEKINLAPKNFELTWGETSQMHARNFKHAFAQHLLVAISSNYYSINKVQFKGVKHIEASIASSPDLDISNTYLKTLSDSVKWMYSLEDPSTPIQLFIDRLSLENSNSDLLYIKENILNSCLNQAKNNYKFVIAKRSDDYRKELKDIYTDIKTVTTKYMDKSASLSSELIKSLLTIGFVFTVGTISKAIVNNELLHSPEGILLLKFIGLYLVVSFLLNWLNASADLKIALNALSSWSDKLHSHISTNDVNQLIAKQVRWSKYFYLASLAIVTYIQCGLGLAAFYAEGIFWYFGI